MIQRRLYLGDDLHGAKVALLPGSQQHARERDGGTAKAVGHEGGAVFLFVTAEDAVVGRRVLVEVIDVGVIGWLREGEDDALVFLGSEFILDELKHRRQHGDDADHEHDRYRARLQRACEHIFIAAMQAFEAAIDKTRVSIVVHRWLQHARTHHRRQRQRDDRRYDDGTDQRKGEFLEQYAGKPAEQADRRIHHAQHDRGRDNRLGYFPRTLQCGLHRPKTFADMAVYIFDYQYGVIDQQADCHHHGQQGQPMIDSGIVTRGISVERNEPRNRNITTTTMMAACASVPMTSLIEASMNSVES